MNTRKDSRLVRGLVRGALAAAGLLIAGTAIPADSAFGTNCPRTGPKKAKTVRCPPPDLKITKKAPTSVALGETITFTVTVANVGPSAVPRTDVTVTDPSISAIPLVFHAVITGDQDTSLEPGEVWEYRLPGGAVSVVAETCRPVVNTARVAALPHETTLANNVSTVTTDVLCRPDLTIVKASDASGYVPGNTVRYTITVTNTGQTPIPFGEISVSDPTLPGLTLVGAPPEFLPPGGTLTYSGTRVATIADCGTIANTATVTFTGEGAEITMENNTAAATVTVTCTPGLALTKRAGKVVYSPGESITYTIVVTNTGQTTIPLAQVRVADPAITGLAVVSPAPLSLVPGSSVSFVGTRATTTGDCGQLANTATATFTRPDAPPIVVSGATTVTVAGGACTPPTVDAVLTIDKRGPAVGKARSTIVYTLVVTNTGPVTARNVVVAESVPGGMVLVTRPRRATLIKGTLHWAVGDLSPGQSVTLRVALKTTFRGASTRCNTAGADADNAAQVTDSLCTRFTAVAGEQFVPPRVTG